MVSAVQVGHLLHSLHIDPRQLPGQPDLAAFEDIYKAGALHHAHPSAAAEHAANAQRLAQLQGPANGWVAPSCSCQPLHSMPFVMWRQMLRGLRIECFTSTTTQSSTKCITLSSGRPAQLLTLYWVGPVSMWMSSTAGLKS